MNKHTMSDLYSMQAAPLSVKIKMTARRIRDWVDEYGQDGVYVSFSGGKDSTVLVDIVRNVEDADGHKSEFEECYGSTIEVNGNRFDNPELLESEE